MLTRIITRHNNIHGDVISFLIYKRFCCPRFILLSTLLQTPSCPDFFSMRRYPLREAILGKILRHSNEYNDDDNDDNNDNVRKIIMKENNDDNDMITNSQ